MSYNDPISDMLTRIRNAARNRAKDVACVNNKVCRGIAQVMQDEGYITGFETFEGEKASMLKLNLKYGPRGETILHTLKRESKPGCRIYSKVADLPRPLQGLGIAVVSTSSGIISDRKARELGVGGELLCTIS